MTQLIKGPKLLLMVIFIFLLVLPVFMDSRSMLILFTQIFIFALFAMSFDILLGYTGIVSFGHCMFFGIGAYSVALMMDYQESTLSSFAIGVLIAVLLAACVSYIIGMLSLRLKSHYYAMLTLAVSQLLLVLADKWRTVTHGGDGFTFNVPDIFRDRLSFYYITLICLVAFFIILRLFTASSIGKVLKAISQNEQRVEALGYKTLHYKVIAGIIAAFSGALYVITLRFVNTAVFSIDITLDALLMTMLGGVGTLIGPILGAGVLEFIQHYLSELAADYPIFERWTIILGVLYIIVLLGFPSGLIGWLNKRMKRKSLPVQKKEKRKAAS